MGKLCRGKAKATLSTPVVHLDHPQTCDTT